MAATCFIWGTPARHDRDGDSTVVHSPRTGGKYRITGSVEALVNQLPENDKIVLTTWLCDQRRLGVSVPEIHTGNYKALVTQRRLNFSKRVERALLFIAHRTRRIDAIFLLSQQEEILPIIAESASADINEVAGLLVLMHNMGLVTGNLDLRDRWQLSPDGWKRVEELTATAVDSSQAFVAMWFSKEVLPAWDDGIKPAIEDAGYKALRIDNIEHNGKVDDRIIAEIRRSRFLVADFSCEKEKVRGGVYYEAGFAEGIGIPIFWTCRAQSMDDLHFDTRQYNHIVWRAPSELKEKLANRIRATIGQGPLK